MNIRCLIGRHSPMLNSILRRNDRYTAVCDHCAMPIERRNGGRWMNAEALVSRQDEAA